MARGTVGASGFLECILVSTLFTSETTMYCGFDDLGVRAGDDAVTGTCWSVTTDTVGGY